MKPRGLRKRGSCKANEWKLFVVHTSRPVLNELLPGEALEGLWLFVQLCEFHSIWSLSEEDVRRVGELFLSIIATTTTISTRNVFIFISS